MASVIAIESPRFHTSVNNILRVDSARKNSSKGFPKLSQTIHVNRTHFISECWDRVILAVDTIIHELKEDDLNSEDILQLIQASKFERDDFRDPLLYDIVVGLNTLFKEIFVNFHVDKPLSFKYAERCRKLLEFAQALKTEEDPDLNAMKNLRLSEIDKFDQHSIYKVE